MKKASNAANIRVDKRLLKGWLTAFATKPFRREILL